MEAECPSPAGSKHITPLLKHFSPSAGHRFPYRYRAAPPTTPLKPPTHGRQPPPLHKSTYIYRLGLFSLKQP